MIYIIYLLNEFDLLKFKYFLIVAALTPAILSIDIIFQYFFGFDFLGFKGTNLFTHIENSTRNQYNSGFFGKELIAGNFIKNFSFFSIFFVAYLMRDKKSLMFLSIILLVCILGLGIIFSGNRMPAILFLFGIFLVFLFKSKLKKTFLASFFVLSTIYILIFNLDNNIKERYLSYYKNAQYLIINIFDLYKYEEPEHTTKKMRKIAKENKLKAINETEEKNIITDDFESFWVLHSTRGHHRKIFLTALDIWGNNKIFGKGIKSFRQECERIAIHNKNRLCSNHPHNYYFEILTDTGSVGIFTVIIMGLSFMVFIIRKYNFLNNNNLGNLIIFAATISLILETFPIKSTGGFFTTSNATYLMLIASIVLCHNKLLSSKDVFK